jgi:hypothetical protein
MFNSYALIIKINFVPIGQNYLLNPVIGKTTLLMLRENGFKY